MAKNLVIVESPAKAKTIKKYLGGDFEVLASYGHVRDLEPKNGAVDPEHDFAMKYVVLSKNAKHIAVITAAVKDAEGIYLATDPDREGEAIAWHIEELLRAKKVLKKQAVYRIAFHEITKKAILDAVKKPRNILMDLVDAQQARRALDYLVGFNLSPLLWKKIRYGLSAGRVQSPALRMIVAREEEIEAFKPQEYWSITAKNQFKNQDFAAKLISYQGEKLTQFSFESATQVEKIRRDLERLAAGKLVVFSVEYKKRKRNPAPPFTTSTLQQEASKRLGFAAKRTMSIAQKLYEAGLITYMRTDSVNLAEEAVAEMRITIAKLFGAAKIPAKPRIYKAKSKSAQEAHEAIRPTMAAKTPELLGKELTPEQIKLYRLIWQRALASQMSIALIEAMVVELSCGDSQNIFRATGSRILDPGFLSVYPEKIDNDEDEKLPALAVGDQVTLRELVADQHFTEPPPRYSEANLVKTLEEYGIGRPSTYATIIDTLLGRGYAILENKRFKPTDIGRIVNKFLVNYFTQYVDYTFTANLEDELDAVANGKCQFLKLMRNFWQPFNLQVEHVNQTVKRSDVTQEQLDEKCPKCGKALMIRLGKSGRFIGCSGYPECDYTANIEEKDEAETEAASVETITDRQCPDCGSPLQVRMGRYGKFIGCSNYPKCKYIEPLEKPQNTGVICPVCLKGMLVKRKSRYGKSFYSCSSYPKCKYAVWHLPIAESCPKCGWKILTLKETKRRGREKICPQKECGYTIVVE